MSDAGEDHRFTSMLARLFRAPSEQCDLEMYPSLLDVVYLEGAQLQVV
jgi:hypothetical protein